MRPRTPKDDVSRRLIKLSQLEHAALKPTGRRGLFRRVLLATDGSRASAAALAWAREVHHRLGAKVSVMTVAGPRHRYAFVGTDSARLWEAEIAAANRVLNGAVRRLLKLGIRAKGVLAFGSPAHQVVSYARRTKTDLIIVGSHGRGGVKRLLLGSVADAVKDAASCAVLIAKRAPPARHVLIAADESLAGRTVIRHGLTMAKAFGTDARILHVIRAPEFTAGEALVHLIEEQAQRMIQPHGRPRIEVRVGAEPEHILRAVAAARSSFLVVGSRGLHGVGRLLLGSVSNRVAHQSRASVLIVRSEKNRAGGSG